MNIIIENVGKYVFFFGRGDLIKEFKKFVRNELVNKIEENIEKYDIFIIEIIGYIDSKIVSSFYSNLDNILEKVVN